MEHSPCGRSDHGTAPPSSSVHQQQQEKEKEQHQQTEVFAQPKEESHQEQLNKDQRADNIQSQTHIQRKEQPELKPSPLTLPRQRPPQPDDKQKGSHPPLTKQAVATLADSGSAAAAATTGAAAPAALVSVSKASLRSPVFADLPVSSSSSSAIAVASRAKHSVPDAGTASISTSGAHHSSSTASKAKATTSHDRMEALGGGPGYPYGSPYIVPANAAAYKPGGNVPPSTQVNLRGAWPPPHIEGFASLPVGSSSLYSPYLSLSGLSPSAAPLGGVAFLPPSSIPSSDGQPVPPTIHPPHVDKRLLPFHHSPTVREKDSLSLLGLDTARHPGLPKRHPGLSKIEVDAMTVTSRAAGKHEKSVSREGSETMARSGQHHQASGKRHHVKEESHLHSQTESSAAKCHRMDVGSDVSDSRTLLKRAGQQSGPESGKGSSPPSQHNRDKGDVGGGSGTGFGSDGAEKRRKSSKKRVEQADENGNSLKTNDSKSATAASASSSVTSGKSISEKLGSTPSTMKVPGVGLGAVGNMGQVLSVGVEPYVHSGDVHHASSLLKTVSPPISAGAGLTGEGQKQFLQQKAAPPGIAPILSPLGMGVSQTNHAQARRHSPKESAKRASESGSTRQGRDEKNCQVSPKGATKCPMEKLTSPVTGLPGGTMQANLSPKLTTTSSSMTSVTSDAATTSTTSPSNTVQLGYMPMYLPNTCQLSHEKESNKDAPKSGMKVHATTFVPAPGEFIPGPATNATVGLSAGKDSHRSKASPTGASRKSPGPTGGKPKGADAGSVGKKDSPKGSSAQKNSLQTEIGARHDDKKPSGRSPGDYTDSGKGHGVGIEPKDDMHSKHEESEKRDSRKRHMSGSSASTGKYTSRGDTKSERTSSHSGGKHGDRARCVSGPDSVGSGLLSPRERETNTKHSDRHASEKPGEEHRRMELSVGRGSHPAMYYDVGMVADRSRTDPSIPTPNFHGECFSQASAAQEALARHESMLRTVLMGSAHRMPSASGAPLSPNTLVSSYSSSSATTHAPSSGKKTTGLSSDMPGLQGRGTPGMKTSDGRCPPIGIAVAQQRQEGDSASSQGRGPPRSSSRNSTSSPHVSRVLPSTASSIDKRDMDEERLGRSRDPSGSGHGRLGERDGRSNRDLSPRESRPGSDVPPFHLGGHRRYPHDLSSNLVVTGGGSSIGRAEATIHPHLPATPHHWLPRPPSHAGATPSPLWPYGIPTSSPMSGTTGLDASPRGSPFPIGPGGMHWAQDPTTGQLMLVPPHPAHAADSSLANLAIWPRYLVPPHLQPHSHQLQQLMLNQYPYGPLPSPAHPATQHPALLQHAIPGAGGSAEMQALLQQHQEALASMYRHAEQQERHRKEQGKPSAGGASGDHSGLKLSSESLLKGGSGSHRHRRESGDVKAEVRPESRQSQSERSRTGSHESLDIKHSIHHAQAPFLPAIPVAGSQHPLPFMYPPPVPYLYENPPPPTPPGPATPGSRMCHESKDKKEYLPERISNLPLQGASPRSQKDKHESELKSTSVQTSPAETPPALTAKVEADVEVDGDSKTRKISAIAPRTQRTSADQQKWISEPNIDVVTVDSPDIHRSSSTPIVVSDSSCSALTKVEKQEEKESPLDQSHHNLSIQTDPIKTEAICIKKEVVAEIVSKEQDKIEPQSVSEVQSKEERPVQEVMPNEKSEIEEDVQSSDVASVAPPASSSLECKTEETPEAPITTAVPTSNQDIVVTNAMTTIQSFASTMDGLDQDQLAAIEGIALLSEVAERKADAIRAEFWKCVAEQHETENSNAEDAEDAESTVTTESNAPLQGNSVSAMNTNGGCEMEEDGLSGLTAGELSLKVRCPITIKKEANGRSEVSACGTPLGSAENMNPMELEMRMKLAELQRKYKEKKKELDKLQKKKDKKAKEDSKNNSPEVEKKRGRGRPRKRKISNKSGSETPMEAAPAEKEVKSLHTSAAVLLEAAASLEEPQPKKKKKKEQKVKKEGKDKPAKQGKKTKKSKTKTEAEDCQAPVSSETTTTTTMTTPTTATTTATAITTTKTKKKKDKRKSSSPSRASVSPARDHVSSVKVKGMKGSKKRLGSPVAGEVPSKKQLSKSATRKLQATSQANQDSLTSDTDSGSIIWPHTMAATPSSPSSASIKAPKSPRTKTSKLSKKLKKEGKLGLSSSSSSSGVRKKRTKPKESATLTSISKSLNLDKSDALPTKLEKLSLSDTTKPKSGLSFAHVYGEDSDSTLDDGSITPSDNSSQPQNNWNSHKGLALLAELSSTQSSPRSATPIKAKKKKMKDKKEKSSSSSTSFGLSTKDKTNKSSLSSSSGLSSKDKDKTKPASSSSSSPNLSNKEKTKTSSSSSLGASTKDSSSFRSSKSSKLVSSRMAKRQGGVEVRSKVSSKKMKLLKKKLSPHRNEKGSLLKKVKKMNRMNKNNKSSSSKGDRRKKIKSASSDRSESRQQRPSTPPRADPNSSSAPQFDEKVWCRRRSERIFLSDISPIQSRDISPQQKPVEMPEVAAKKKILQVTPTKKPAEETAGNSATGATGQVTAHGVATSQIGSVLDALKTDPLQMRKKLIRLSAPEEDDEEEDGKRRDEFRKKKLKKKAKKKDRMPGRERLNPLELALVAKDLTDSSDSDGENLPLSSLVERPSTPAPRNCVLSIEELKDGLRVLIPIDGLFHAGNVRAIQPPDVYGVVIEGGRGSRPHVFSQEQILQEAIADVKPSSTRYLPEGTRICAYWSQQYKYLYPGTVVKGSPNPVLDSNFTTVEFDDGDSGRIPLDHIRMLPQDFPIVNFEPSPIMVQRKRRRRPSEASSTTDWKMDDMKDDLDGEERHDGYSWHSRSSRDDGHAISEGDNDVFLPIRSSSSRPKTKKLNSSKSLKKSSGLKKTKNKLKLKNKNKTSFTALKKSSSSSSSSSKPGIVSGLSSIKPKIGNKLSKLSKKRKGVSAKFAEKVLQKKQGKVFDLKGKKGKSSSSSADGKTSSGKKKGSKKKLGGGSSSSRAKCTVEIETVYSSEVFPEQLTLREGLDRDGLDSSLRNNDYDSDDSSDDESDHYTQSAEIVKKKKKTKKRKRSSQSSSCSMPSPMSPLSPPGQFWRWLGKATQRRGSKGKARKLFYKSIVRDREVIRVGECAVFLSTRRTPQLPYIGRIESMWESWGGMMVVRVKWFYHPEETRGGRKPNDGKMALYLSQHVDENDVQTISHKCEVLSIDEHKQYMSGKRSVSTTARSENIYYLAGTYDPGSGQTVSAT